VIYIIVCTGHKSDKDEFGKEFYISRHTMNNLLNVELIKEIICKIRAKLKYYNLTISTQAPNKEIR
jgi:hypothetical protein